jgi:hypothetical protein
MHREGAEASSGMSQPAISKKADLNLSARAVLWRFSIPQSSRSAIVERVPSRAREAVYERLPHCVKNAPDAADRASESMSADARSMSARTARHLHENTRPAHSCARNNSRLREW